MYDQSTGIHHYEEKDKDRPSYYQRFECELTYIPTGEKVNKTMYFARACEFYKLIERWNTLSLVWSYRKVGM